MLPVCHCSFGLLRSVRGIAALTQSKLHKVVDILKGDRLLIYLDHAANEPVIAVAEPRLRRLRSLAEDDAVPRHKVTGHGVAASLRMP